MALTYNNLSPEDQNRIRANVAGAEPEPDYDSFLPNWEAEHFTHSVLLEQATANGDEDAANAAREAMATLEAAVTNVRAGKRPDGTNRPVAPTPPPAPEPTPPAPGPQG